jgi:hypothetical protein
MCRILSAAIDVISNHLSRRCGDCIVYNTCLSGSNPSDPFLLRFRCSEKFAKIFFQILFHASLRQCRKVTGQIPAVELAGIEAVSLGISITL